MAAPKTTPWTEETHAQLVSLIDRGLTGGQIAAVMGMSRCAILGKINRCDLKLHGSNGSNGFKFDWTDERDQQLRELAANKASRAKIATHFGISQKTLSRRLKTLGIQVRQSRFGTAAKRPRRPASIPNMDWFKTEPTEPRPSIRKFTLRLQDLQDWHCRWPDDSEDKFRFCGKPKFARGRRVFSYCLEHCRKAYTAARPPAPVNYARTFSSVRGFL